jgi:uncharacterized protein (TIGR03437 family)
MAPFANAGPRHLVLNYGSDIYVMPQALNLVGQPAPAITFVTSNIDGSATIAGTNFGGDSLVYFDGVPAARSGVLSGNEVQGSLNVLAPAGASGQVSQIIVYNSDGQNSTFGAWDSPPTFTYPSVFPSAGTAQIQSLSVSSLPAGTTAMVDITTQNTAFIDGEVSVGFGSGDITVQRVWVLSPTRLLANITVAANAGAGSSEFSVISGFQVIAQHNAFQVMPGNPNLPVIAAVSNADPTQKTVYPGGYAAIYGVNLANVVQVTLGDRRLAPQVGGVFPGQVNFVIPADFPTGPAILQLNSGTIAAYPIVVQVDLSPPLIQSVTNASGVPYDATHPAQAKDVITVNVTGLDQSVIASPGRLQVTVNGQAMPVQPLTPAVNGQTQIVFSLLQNFGGGVVNLAVVVDGSSNPPVALVVGR